MSRISQNAFTRIAEQALGVLYDSFPVPLSTRQVSLQLVRDNEFTLTVLLFLEKQRLSQRVKQGKTGDLERTVLWKISPDAKKRFDAAS
ncbi:MAG TPA: hypothetical protein VI874_04195 [Candidatus Norongarragalinales archaeon]|nr:hypothetical protein [Candidatus Norongarragalinales archaeon]